MTTDPVSGITNAIAFVGGSISLVADPISLMALLVARSCQVIPLVTDLVSPSRGPVPLVTDPIATIGHIVAIIGELITTPLRPRPRWAWRIICMVAFIGCAFTPVIGQAPARDGFIAFVSGQDPFLAG